MDFLEFCKKETPKNICEIGTECGGTFFILSQTLPSVSLAIGIDIYVRNKSRLLYLSKAHQELKFINGSSSAPRTIRRVKELLGGRRLDLLFIDGDHSYEGVKRDFLRYRFLLHDNSIVVFHDIVPDYYSRYGIRSGRYTGGAPLFWSKISKVYPSCQFVKDINQDGLGIGVIKYIEKAPLPADL